MAREIKFRVWDKSENKMSYSDTEFFDDMIGFRFSHWGIDVDSVDDIEIMQFTGLKDKKKEIYEGDILRTVNFFDTNNKPVYLHHKVVYDTERAVYNAINLSNDNDLLTTNGNCFLYVALKTPLIEVIGNIYENPELLKS